MSPCVLHKMIQKVETTEKVGILPSRLDDEKKIPSSIIENVATAVLETSSHSLHGNERMLDIFLVLDISYSPIQKVLPGILYFIPRKSCL